MYNKKRKGYTRINKENKMRIHTKMVLRVAFLVSVTLAMMWGMSELVKGNDTMATVECNPDATSINDARCLQDMNDSIKESMVVETQYSLVDIRDEKGYWVSLLEDGNIWMTQNLELGNALSAIDLSPDDTDISPSSTFTSLPAGTALTNADEDLYTTDGGYIAGAGFWVQNSGSFVRDMVKTNGSDHYRVGNGYPWTVATAQTTEYVDPTGQDGINPEPVDSICPAGWKLPSQDEYSALLAVYNLSGEGVDEATAIEISGQLRVEPFLFVRGFPYMLGTNGHYWTSTTSVEDEHYVARVFFLDGYNSGVSSQADEISGIVDAMRCIARSDSDISYTLSYNLNGGTGTISDDIVSSSRKKIVATVTDAEPTLANHAFLGWANSSSATVAEYDGGDEITLGGDKTLYAVWEVVISDQVVSFEQTSVEKTYGDSDFTNAATTTGNGTISYSSSNSGVAEVNENTGKVTIVGAGTATITANASATDYYRAASETYTLTVSKATPTVSFENTTVTKNYLDENFINKATAIGGGGIYYESDNTNVASIDSTTGEVTIFGVGTAIITATATATNNYNAASATYTLTVDRSTPTIAFANTSVTKTYGDAKFINAATTISDGTITYVSNNTDVATVNSATGEVTIAKVGTATITASVPATANYGEASATYNLTVNKKTSSAPAEVSETKDGYVTDAVSTIDLNTPGLVWNNPFEKIKEGNYGYAVKYTENADTTNYTTESFEITVHGVRRTYEVVDGDGQDYKQKGDQDIIRFIIGAEYDLFENGGEIRINDAVLDVQYYTAEADDDMMVISISNEYLESLEAGEYNISMYFNDGGIAEAEFIVEKADEEEGEDEEKEDEGEGGDEVPVPDTGRMNQGGVSVGVGTLLGVTPAIIIAGVMIARYCYGARKAHRKFEW